MHARFLHAVRLVLASAVLLTYGAAAQAVATSANYVFTTTTAASLDDMSADTTTLIAANQDDVASPVTPIGFDFYFMGTRRGTFSVNSNGAMRMDGQGATLSSFYPMGTNFPYIMAYAADQRTHPGDGKVHYKVIGTAPNRRLTVEWLNMVSDFHDTGTADLTYQVHLYESTGVIEFVYGAMKLSAVGAADSNSRSPQIGFSSLALAGRIGSIAAPQSGTPPPSFDGTTGLIANNQYVAGPIPVLTSAADGARRSFALTPPTVAPPGGPLTFAGVTTTAMTLNWTDSPNETGYEVYVSTDDGATYSLAAALPPDTTSYNASGLFAATNYTWRVVAYSEGAVSALVGAQLTSAPTPNTGVSGPWSAPATWSAGHVPTSGEAVTIAAGATVTIDISATAYSVDVAGTLQFEQNISRPLNLGGNLVIENGGVLRSNPNGSATGHAINVPGNVINNGTLDLSTNGNLAGASLNFTGAKNTSFTGAGAITNIRQIAVTKGVGQVDLMPTNFTVRGSTGDSPTGWLVHSSGTLRIAGTFTGSHHLIDGQYLVYGNSVLWLDNPNYTVLGQHQDSILLGTLRVSQGAFNLGTTPADNVDLTKVILEGGTINLTGGLRGVSGNSVDYQQSAGTFTACIGADPTTRSCFDLGNGPAPVAFSGGAIVIQNARGGLAYRSLSTAGAGMTGGTLQLGNAASGTAQSFKVRGRMPNLLVTNTSAAHGAVVDTTGSGSNSSRDITLQAGTTLDIGNAPFQMGGSTFINNGSFKADGASSDFTWADTGQGVQTYTGNGNVTGAVTAMTVQTGTALTLSSTNPLVVNRLTLISGNLVGANHLTLGSGSATPTLLQIGNTSVPSPAGSFDVAPNFNLGSGGQSVSYLRTTTSRSTGLEINPARTLANLTYDDNDPTHALTLAGGNVSVNSLALTSGRVVTGANTLGVTGSVNRSAGHVDGKLRLTLNASINTTFDVGTANGYSPVYISATSGTLPADVTASAVQGIAPGVAPVANVINRYWTIAANNIDAQVSFRYLDPIDLGGSINEASLHVLRKGTANASDYADLGGSVNTSSDLVSLGSVSSFSTFTLGIAEADLAIAVNDNVSTALAGGALTYHIVASNGGTVGNPTAMIADTFPSALNCSTTCSGTNGGTCTTGPFPGAINDAANLPAGASVHYIANCQVNAAATGTIVNTAQIAGGGVADNHPSNDAATDTDAIVSVHLVATLDDSGHAYARYGQLRDYQFSIANNGASAVSDVGIVQTLSSDFDAAATTWTCSGTGGASCTASGNGPLSQSNLTIPAAGALNWLITAPILANAPHATADNTIVVTTALDPLAPYTVTDSDILVVFRNGFDTVGADGTNITDSGVLTALDPPLSSNASIAFDVPPVSAGNAIVRLLRARALDGSGFRVERASLGHASYLRIVSIGLLGVEQAGAWVPAKVGDTALVALVDDGGSVAILVTASGESTVHLAAGTTQAYLIDTAVNATVR